MKTIVALCDYHNRFGSKYFDRPYRSGMDKDLLRKSFYEKGYELNFCRLADMAIRTKRIDCPVIYTSQEDYGYRYKSFIEDVILGMETSGENVIPPFRYLRANNNKVFMEILRQQILPSQFHANSMVFGCFEEIEAVIDTITYPVVIKTAKGAGSHGVFKAENREELIRYVKKISRTKYHMEELRDQARFMRHKGYLRESLYRDKFIMQDFVPGLENDWKVLVFYDRFYVLRRKNRPGDFRASGSGLFSFDEVVDPELLDAAKLIYSSFDVPMISIDLAKSGAKIHLIEFQFVYFGTSTLEKSPYYYTRETSGWNQVHAKSVVENEYASSIVKYLDHSS